MLEECLQYFMLELVHILMLKDVILSVRKKSIDCKKKKKERKKERNLKMLSTVLFFFQQIFSMFQERWLYIVT